jgi:L-lactate utilization protein LutB
VDKPINSYWKKRLTDLKTALESNNFEVFLADDKDGAYKVVLDEIIPPLKARTISWGGSMTFIDTGLYEQLKENSELEVLDSFDKNMSPEDMLERRRQSLLVDLFITGTNAVTETGQLVNLDMIGNRIGALTFGPKWVIILVGRNKITADLDEAMFRVKNYVARKSPDRICNTWTITEKAFPKGRVKVVLINEDLGF